MKLLSNYYRTNIVAIVIIVLLSSCAYFFIIHYVLVRQLDSTLEVEEQEVLDNVKETGNLPAPSDYKDQQVIFKPAGDEHLKRNFKTINFYDKEENENIVVRQLSFLIVVSGKPWDVYIIKSQEETEDLVKLILIITLAVLLTLLLILFLINRFILRRQWKPFHSTLNQLKEFNLSARIKLHLPVTRIDEFKELNEAVSVMVDHVSDEYNTLKNFTDNASHEMQTPLAIINSKLDLLIQDDAISEQQMNLVNSIYIAIDKMSRMNQSLLLLARIENNQFNIKQDIFLDNVIEEKLQQFDELISSNNITVNKNISSVQLSGNKYLLDILINNLISNAIRYNVEKGIIAVGLNGREMIISNTSAIPMLNEQKLFQRFYRHEKTNSDGNGLGLSIIKQICIDAGYSLEYFFENGMHNFCVRFY